MLTAPKESLSQALVAGELITSSPTEIAGAGVNRDKELSLLNKDGDYTGVKATNSLHLIGREIAQSLPNQEIRGRAGFSLSDVAQRAGAAAEEAVRGREELNGLSPDQRDHLVEVSVATAKNAATEVAGELEIKGKVEQDKNLISEKTPVPEAVSVKGHLDPQALTLGPAGIRMPGPEIALQKEGQQTTIAAAVQEKLEQLTRIPEAMQEREQQRTSLPIAIIQGLNLSEEFLRADQEQQPQNTIGITATIRKLTEALGEELAAAIVPIGPRAEPLHQSRQAA